MAARCEDCGALIDGTHAELEAQAHGLSLCEDCIESMEDERDAFEAMHLAGE